MPKTSTGRLVDPDPDPDVEAAPARIGDELDIVSYVGYRYLSRANGIKSLLGALKPMKRTLAPGCR